MRNTSLRVVGPLLGSMWLACAVYAVPADVAQAPGQNDIEMSIQLLDKWQGRINSGQIVVDQPQSWAKRNAGNVAKLNSEHLKMALAADTLAEVELFWQKSPIPAGTPLALIRKSNTFKGDVSFQFGATKAGGIAPDSLGNDDRDLVFTPVAPCRMLDTRFSNWSNDNSASYNGLGNSPAIAGGRSLLIVGASISSYQFQGGFGGNCMPTANSPKAYLVSLNAINPSVDGYFAAYADGAPNPYPNSVSTFYRAGQINTAFIIMNSDSTPPTFSRVYTTATTHITMDVVGFFEEPVATALDCVSVSGPVITVAANSGGTNAPFGSCPAGGYRQTATYCVTDTSFAARVSGWNSAQCNFTNSSAAALNVHADMTCCRIPGR